MRGDLALAEQHPHFFRDDRHREQHLLWASVMGLKLALRITTAGDVVDQERMFQRRAGAFHLGRGAGEKADAALFGEFMGRLPCLRGILRPGIERADAVLPDHI